MMDVLVLSAGKASRFGLPKFLLPAGEGLTLLTRAIENALLAVEGRIVVVIGRNAELARADIENWLWPENAARVQIVENPDFEQGLSTSLKVGVKHLSDSRAVLVLLSDQPALDVLKLRELIERFEAKDPSVWAVSAAEYGEAKPPMVLSGEMLAQVGQLRGDQGFKPLLKQNAEHMRLLEWGGGRWFTDVDTWEVYRALAFELGWQNEAFEPVEGLNLIGILERLNRETPDTKQKLRFLRQAVLTELNK